MVERRELGTQEESSLEAVSRMDPSAAFSSQPDVRPGQTDASKACASPIARTAASNAFVSLNPASGSMHLTHALQFEDGQLRLCMCCWCLETAVARVNLHATNSLTFSNALAPIQTEPCHKRQHDCCMKRHTLQQQGFLPAPHDVS